MLHLKPGQRISRSDLDHIVAQIYGTHAYDYVTYELLGDEEPFKLVLNCRKGPVHQFGIGVRADSEEIVSVLVNVGFNAHKLYANTFDLTGKISANPYFQFKWSFGRIGKVEIDSPLAVFSGDGLFFLFVEFDCNLFAGISLAENRNFCPFCQHRMIGKNPRHNHLCA